MHNKLGSDLKIAIERVLPLTHVMGAEALASLRENVTDSNESVKRHIWPTRGSSSGSILTKNNICENNIFRNEKKQYLVTFFLNVAHVKECLGTCSSDVFKQVKQYYHFDK